MSHRTAIVMEHIKWCRSQGWTPKRVVASVGIKIHGNGKPGWDDAAQAVAMAYERLEEKKYVRLVRRMNGFARI